ncbi:MAG: gamma-glutamyl-gamma-aminobutyrate hydrolase family protein, partial [Pygmaiobacter sp.]
MMRHILNETKLPVLGVCRGIQILNVALGGTIYQDIDSSKFNNHINLMYSKCDWSHHVTVKKNSRLHHAVQNDVIGVNSFHHQAIHKLGSNLDVVAVAEDGIVEAVEYNDASRFVLA